MESWEVNYLVVHTAATKPNMDIGAKEIDRWHKDRGWSGIGYHYVIRRDGRVEGGRPTNRKGAHVKGHNHESIGVCLIGGIDMDGEPEDNYTGDQWVSLINLLHNLKSRYPRAEILGHRDFPGVNKACPCFDVRAKLPEWGLA